MKNIQNFLRKIANTIKYSSLEKIIKNLFNNPYVKEEIKGIPIIIDFSPLAINNEGDFDLNLWKKLVNSNQGQYAINHLLKNLLNILTIKYNPYIKKIEITPTSSSFINANWNWGIYFKTKNGKELSRLIYSNLLGLTFKLTNWPQAFERGSNFIEEDDEYGLNIPKTFDTSLYEEKEINPFQKYKVDLPNELEKNYKFDPIENAMFLNFYGFHY